MAFGDELLPAILGGSWSMSRFLSAHLPDCSMRGGELIVEYAPTLFDAPTEYRKLSSRGRPSSTFAIVSKSSNVFDGDAVSQLSRMAAIGLVQQMIHPYRPSPPFSVWAKRLVQSDDAVVVGAFNLDPDRAAEYGFTILAPASH
jgi:hypothetical protein